MQKSLSGLMKQAMSLIVVSGLLVGCQQQDEVQTESPVRPVKIVSPVDIAGERVRVFSAEVEATEDAALTFRVSGQLNELLVNPGQTVQKGEVLARLDPTDFEVSLQQAKAQHELTLAQFNRIKKLLGTQSISASQFDEISAQLKVAESNLVAANNNLNYTVLKAPFEGVIARIYVENFEQVIAKQTIVDLQKRSEVDVVIQVPEAIIARAKKGNNYQPTVVFDSYPQYEYKLSIKEWESKADPATKSYRVVFTMPSPTEFNVLAGMTAQVTIEVDKVTDLEFGQLVIPNQAVFTETGSEQHFVWLVNEQGIVSRQAIEIGELRSQGVIVLSGLDKHHKIVAAGVHLIQDGMQVKAWNREKGL